jgi:raffinose/stachyose/melibiose transport system permease protein
MAIPGTFLYSLFFIIPVAMGIYYSVTDWNGIARTNNFVGLANYIHALTDKRFLRALLFNFRYSVLYVVSILVLATIIALLLNQKVKGMTGFRAIYFLPALFSGVTISLIFNQIFFRVIPAVGGWAGIEALQKSLLSNKSTAIYAILIVNLWCALPLQSILILAGLQTIPEDLIEAAKIDGANPGQLFRHITIPHLLPTLSIVMVLAVKGGLMIFDLIKVLTDGGPNNATRSVSILIYNDAFRNNQFSLSMAEALIVGVIVAIISFVQLKLSNRNSV